MSLKCSGTSSGNMASEATAGLTASQFVWFTRSRHRPSDFAEATAPLRKAAKRADNQARKVDALKQDTPEFASMAEA
jgi:hypothetical protein